MILVDYNGIAIAAMFSMREKPTEDLLRHVILNSIRMHNVKHRDKYGEMIIACDGGSWRKDVFPQYKAARAAGREESKIDWPFIFDCMNKIRVEIETNLPWKVVHVLGAEADDIIAVMTERTQEFGQCEPVMIISSDKDFIQLQKYKNVQQWSPATKKFLADKNPRRFLFEHICRGDVGDGVPNVLSPDNAFTDSIRQTPLAKGKIDLWYENLARLESLLDAETLRNFRRNKQVIDLDQVPENKKTEIINKYNSLVVRNNTLNYLISKRCRLLIECAADFKNNATINSSNPR
jgi:hypothetical protein